MVSNTGSRSARSVRFFAATAVAALAPLAGAMVACGSTSNSGPAGGDAGVAADAGAIDLAFGDNAFLDIPAVPNRGTPRVRMYEAADQTRTLLLAYDDANTELVAALRLLPDSTNDDTFAGWSETDRGDLAVREDLVDGCLDDQRRLIIMSYKTNQQINGAAVDQAVVKRLDATGKLDMSFGMAGVASVNRFAPVSLRCDGDTVVLLGTGKSNVGFETSLQRWVLTGDGHGGTSAPATSTASAAVDGPPSWDGADGVLAFVGHPDKTYDLVHYDASGMRDGFAGGGAYTIPSEHQPAIKAIDVKTGVIALENTTTTAEVVTFLSKDGALLATHSLPADASYDVVFDSQSRAVVVRSLGLGPDSSKALGFAVRRYRADGTADDAFGERIFSLASFRALGFKLTEVSATAVARSAGDHVLVAIQGDLVRPGRTPPALLMRLNP